MMHTTEPWVFDGEVAVNAVGERPCAACGHTEHLRLVALVYGDHHNADLHYTKDANGHLIAAAPDLLRALARLTHEILAITDQSDAGRLDAVERLHKHGEVIEMARAALAKATGQP